MDKHMDIVQFSSWSKYENEMPQKQSSLKQCNRYRKYINRMCLYCMVWDEEPIGKMKSRDSISTCQKMEYESNISIDAGSK